MEFDSLTRMWVSGKRVDVLPSAQRLLANRLRVPFSYLNRCPADLQAQNLNFWIEQEHLAFAYFFVAFELIGRIVLDKLKRRCHGHHKTHNLEVYDDPENRESRHDTAHHCDC
jgi:hypothetical protein